MINKMENMDEIIKNWQKYCTEENFIGEGTTRTAYRVKDKVIKKHTHPIGHKQSVNELNLYKKLKGTKLEKFIAPIHYVSEEFQITDYYEEIEKNEDGSGFALDCYDFDSATLKLYFYEDEEEFYDYIAQNGVEDTLSSLNNGIDKNGRVVLIDYGMNNSLYQEFFEETKKGIIPIFSLETCEKCKRDFEYKYYIGKEKTYYICSNCK